MTATLAFFAIDDELSQLRELLGSAHGADRLPALVALAWQLRQREGSQALALAGEADEALAALPVATAPLSALHRNLAARLLLVRAEQDWLFARLDAAQALADAAMREFAVLEDPIGVADCHWIRAMLAIDRGDWPAKGRELEAMATAAQAADPARAQAAQAAQAYFAAFRDLPAAQARWGASMATGRFGMHPASACWAEDFLAVGCYQSGDFAPAIRHFIEAYSLALASGQPRRAVIAATNAGGAFNHLNDYQGSLEWMQRGIDLARQLGFPGTMGVALLQTAHTLRLLNRLDASREMLHEALVWMAPLAGSRNHAYALWHLSEVELSAGHWTVALDTFRALEARADFLQQPDLQSHARCGQARAWLALGEPQAAVAAAEAALNFARDVSNRHVTALQVLAEIHTAHPELPAPAALQAPSVPLHYLQQALARAAGIEGLTVPADLLEACAQEHARLGDFEAAYGLSLQARASRQTSHSQEASNRAIAMQVTHQTDRARAEAEHQRSLAQAHAERLTTLEQLGTIGQDITRVLELSTLFAALQRHVQSLLAPTVFIIYRVAAGGQPLSLAFGIEAGEALVPRRFGLGEAPPDVVQCAREGREVRVDHLPDEAAAPGVRPAMLSLVHAPLQVGDRLLGVMSIQSERPHAYAERELAIFRTLCAYGAIALANAEAQTELVEKNRQLQQLSVSDHLTGLSNRLRLDQVLHEEVWFHERNGSALSVILMDLDDFKSVNDRWGHQVGDQVLMAVASLLIGGSRQTDVVGRWGGEEFMLVCRGTDLAGAAVLADKLRCRIAAHAFAQVGRKTASLGVASLRQGETADLVIARADEALYRAKRAGRNQVALEEPEPPAGRPGLARPAEPDPPAS